jgi:hypothetical protein
MIRSLELEECPGTCAVLLTAEDNYTRTGATFAKTAVGSASVCPEGHGYACPTGQKYALIHGKILELEKF